MPLKVSIVLFDNANAISGVSSWVQNIAPELHKLGVHVDVHLLEEPGTIGFNRKHLQALNVPIKARIWQHDLKKDMRSCLEMAVESQVDVYIPNCILPAYYAAGFLRQMGVKTIGVLHADDKFYSTILDEFTGKHQMFQLDAVVAVSKELEKKALANRHHQAVKVERIPCGIKVPEQAPTKAISPFRLVYTGRFVEEQKRIKLVTASFCKITEQNTDTQGLLIGDGCALPDITKILNRHPNASVQILGKKSPREVHDILNTCTVFVLLSDYEGLPVSLMEAMGRGVIPVCFRCSGIAELVTHNKSGIILENREDIYAAISDLIRNPEKARTLAENTRRAITQEYEITSTAKQWFNCFNNTTGHTLPLRIPVKLKLPHIPKVFREYTYPKISVAQIKAAASRQLPGCYKTLKSVKLWLCGNQEEP